MGASFIPSSTHPLTPASARSPAGPLFIWLIIQLLALSLGVCRVPLAARVVQPEQFALHAMLVTQVIASAMLFPFILRDVTTSAMAILAIAPFVQLASYLSEIPLRSAALAGAYVAMWMLALSMWKSILRTPRSEMLAVACATAITIGGAIVWYVRAEEIESGQIAWSMDALLGPILGVIAQLHAPTNAALIAWSWPIVILVTCALARVTTRPSRDR
jgi:hypothetical protein